MYRHAVAFEVLVRGADVAVARLVTSDHNTFGIGKVADAAVLQRIELLAVVPFQCLAYFGKVLAENTAVSLLFARLEILAEQVALAGLVEHAQFYHKFDDFIIQTYHAVLAVLADGGGDKHFLLGHMDML